MPDPEPSLLAGSSIHQWEGQADHWCPTQTSPLAGVMPFPRGLTITTDLHIPLGLCSYLRSHFARLPPWSWCLWKETQSISAAWKWYSHFWTQVASCSKEVQWGVEVPSCWYLLLRHKLFVESEKRPASLHNKVPLCWHLESFNRKFSVDL